MNADNFLHIFYVVRKDCMYVYNIKCEFTTKMNLLCDLSMSSDTYSHGIWIIQVEIMHSQEKIHYIFNIFLCINLLELHVTETEKYIDL